jgi:hypothetical protein
VTVEANGAQVSAPPAGLDSGPPYGGTVFGAGAPQSAPPPPPTALDGRLAEYQSLVNEMAALLQEQAAQLEQPKRKAKQPSKTMASVSGFPKRYAVHLCIAAAVVATTVGISQCSPRLSEQEVASIAKQNVMSEVVPALNNGLANNRAEATTVVIPDPLSVYGLELSENAKTAIGWTGQPGSLVLNAARAEYVAKQVRVLSATVRLLDLRLTSAGPTDLRVTTNVAEGFPLFNPPATQAPAAAPTTATSAP